MFIGRTIFLISNHASLIDVKVPHASGTRRDWIGVDTERIERTACLAARRFVGKTVPVLSPACERGIEQISSIRVRGAVSRRTKRRQTRRKSVAVLRRICYVGGHNHA